MKIRASVFKPAVFLALCFSMGITSICAMGEFNYSSDILTNSHKLISVSDLEPLIPYSNEPVNYSSYELPNNTFHQSQTVTNTRDLENSYKNLDEDISKENGENQSECGCKSLQGLGVGACLGINLGGAAGFLVPTFIGAVGGAIAVPVLLIMGGFDPGDPEFAGIIMGAGAILGGISGAIVGIPTAVVGGVLGGIVCGTGGTCIGCYHDVKARLSE